MSNSPVPGVNPGAGKCTSYKLEVLKAERPLGKSNLTVLARKYHLTLCQDDN